MNEDPSSEGLRCCSIGEELPQMLASRLSVKVRRNLPERPLVVGITGAGSELGERVAQQLNLPYQSITIRAVYWPPSSNYYLSNVVGAVSGCTDVVYLDRTALVHAGASQDLLMSHIQRVKLQGVHEAVSKGTTLSGKRWNEKGVLLVCCAHTDYAFIQAAVEITKHKRARELLLVIPFLCGKVKRALMGCVTNFITLNEFEKDDTLADYSANVSEISMLQTGADSRQR